MKHRIVICVDYFEPGYRGGGCLRAVSHLVRSFSGECTLQVLTRDRDLGMNGRYSEAERSTVIWDLGCEIHYLPPGAAAFPLMRRAIEGFKPDVLYLNSAFSPAFTLWPLWAYRRLAKGTLLAPRGELLSGALASKGLKKRVFLALARAVGLYRDIHWHATCPQEVEAITALGLGGRGIHLASDLPGALPAPSNPPRKDPGALDLLFLARIHPMKGLHRMLQWLPEVPGNLRLRIAGPEVDLNYAEACRGLVDGLPERIRVDWLGPLNHQEVLAEFGRAHIYVLPTETENHGYTIQEALACGCPVITSRGTPWKELEGQGAGWSISLEDSVAWCRTLAQLVDMGEEAQALLRQRAFEYGSRSMEGGNAARETRAMFEAVSRDAK